MMSILPHIEEWSGSGGDGQMVTLPLTMSNSLAGQGQPLMTSNNQQQQQQAQQQQQSVNSAPGTTQDPAKRREILSRRPSYRKILNELSGPPESSRVKDEPSGGSKSSESSESDSGSQGITSMQPPTAIAYQTGSGTVTGLQTFSMANALTGQATLVPGDGSGNLWMPGNHVVVHDSQMYQIRAPSSSSNLSSVVMGGAAMQSPQQMAEEASRKRELRLMKNREAAKECRRRKKEYVKCLETRVAVLENQNKQLIDELKTLKELYVHNKVD